MDDGDNRDESKTRNVINQLSRIVVENDQMLDRVSEYHIMFIIIIIIIICLGSGIGEVTAASTFLNKKILFYILVWKREYNHHHN